MAALISTFPIALPKRRKLPCSSPRTSLRVAQVTAPDTLFEGPRYFAPFRGSGLDQFSPQALAGSAHHLTALIHALRQGQLHLPDVTQSVFVLTGCGQVPASDSLRASLWHAFGVPVYELLLDTENVPIASECDAHEGWHIEEGVTFFIQNDQLWFRWRRRQPACTGLTGLVEEQPCPCGRAGKRIVNVEADFRDPLRARLAAIA